MANLQLVAKGAKANLFTTLDLSENSTFAQDGSDLVLAIKDGKRLVYGVPFLSYEEQVEAFKALMD